MTGLSPLSKLSYALDQENNIESTGSNESVERHVMVTNNLLLHARPELLYQWITPHLIVFLVCDAI